MDPKHLSPRKPAEAPKAPSKSTDFPGDNGSAGPSVAAPDGKTKASVNKAAMLKKLSERRIPAAITAINRLQNLTAYGPSEAQKTAILASVQSALDAVKSRFQGAKQATDFILPAE